MAPSTSFSLRAGGVEESLIPNRERKRGGGVRVPLGENDAAIAPPDLDVLALDAALEKLSEQHPRQGKLVELRFFGGLTVEETAAVLGISPITVKRDWRSRARGSIEQWRDARSGIPIRDAGLINCRAAPPSDRLGSRIVPGGSTPQATRTSPDPRLPRRRLDRSASRRLA